VGGKSNQLVGQSVKVVRHLEQYDHDEMPHLALELPIEVLRYMDVEGLQLRHRKRLLQQLCPDTSLQLG
jgi:hypothetical protein